MLNIFIAFVFLMGALTDRLALFTTEAMLVCVRTKNKMLLLNRGYM